MLKRVEIFQHFPKNFTKVKIFLVPRQCFSFFLPCIKGVSFLEQNQLFQLRKMVEILRQNGNFEIVAPTVGFLEQNQLFQLPKMVEILRLNGNFEIASSIIVPQWRRKKLLLI